MSEKVKEMFDKFEGEFLKFKRVESPLHHRPDICAFLLLDKLLPKDRDIVSAAEHDIIYLDCDMEKFEEVATEADILTLSRCGVFVESETYSLAMFV